MSDRNLPVAVIGAGPIGLAAAAHLVERGQKVHVYEAGATVGASIRDWAHVRVFTAWEQNVDTASRRLLEATGWRLDDPQKIPTGDELYRHYLEPLARVPSLAPSIETGVRVTDITRLGCDKITTRDRADKPFELRIERADGTRRTDLARAVIDASGTWQNPNPLGASGLPADGEPALANRIAYGMPDVLGAERRRYANRRIAVVGAGYSAINVLLDLVRLTDTAPQTHVTWLVRGTNLNRIYGGGEADGLAARGRLGTMLRDFVDAGRVTLVTGFHTHSVRGTADGLILAGTGRSGPAAFDGFDEIVACTGQRPDLAMTRELRLELDPWLEGVRALGPLIDPNLHSCGTVPPHGHREVSHPEPGFYTIGVKSYGRAPTFLLLTGYEQARSVAASVAGDLAAADSVSLVLPETGICTDDVVDDAKGGCCKPVAAEVACCTPTVPAGRSAKDASATAAE